MSALSLAVSNPSRALQALELCHQTTATNSMRCESAYLCKEKGNGTLCPETIILPPLISSEAMSARMGVGKGCVGAQ